MPVMKPPSKKIPLPLVIGGVIALVLLAAAAVGLAVTQAAPPQPIAYKHAPHIASGIQCVFCHSGAIRNQSAGLPTAAKCKGCHNNLPAEKPGLKLVADTLSQNSTIEWVPVAILPDFVYFSHQPHVSAGVTCETCHGEVGKMADAQPQRHMDMGWCLDCHRKQPVAKQVKLLDCSNCHK